jgi:hypothetical protein
MIDDLHKLVRLTEALVRLLARTRIPEAKMARMRQLCAGCTDVDISPHDMVIDLYASALMRWPEAHAVAVLDRWRSETWPDWPELKRALQWKALVERIERGERRQ